MIPVPIRHHFLQFMSIEHARWLSSLPWRLAPSHTRLHGAAARAACLQICKGFPVYDSLQSCARCQSLANLCCLHAATRSLWASHGAQRQDGSWRIQHLQTMHLALEHHVRSPCSLMSATSNTNDCQELYLESLESWFDLPCS